VVEGERRVPEAVLAVVLETVRAEVAVQAVIVGTEIRDPSFPSPRHDEGASVLIAVVPPAVARLYANKGCVRIGPRRPKQHELLGREGGVEGQRVAVRLGADISEICGPGKLGEEGISCVRVGPRVQEELTDQRVRELHGRLVARVDS
jgi:hypothetical protein